MRKQYPSKPPKTVEARWRFVLLNLGNVIAHGTIDGLEEEQRNGEEHKEGNNDNTARTYP